MRDEVDDPHPEQKRPATPGLTKGINVYVPSRSSEKLRIDTRTARTIVEKVMRDPRFQHAVAKLSKSSASPVPPPVRKIVPTIPSALPDLAKVFRQRAAIVETLSDIRKQVDDERAVQKSITATLDRVGRKLDAVNEIAERIGKVGERFETFSLQLRGRMQ